MSELFIFNNIGVLEAVIDEYESCEWSRNFMGFGSFSLSISQHLPSAKFIQKRYIIGIKYQGNFDAFYMIEQIEREVSDAIIKVSGREFGGMFEHRIILPPAGLSHDSRIGSCESLIKHFVNTSCAVGAAVERQIPNFYVATDLARGIEVSYDGRYQKLIEAITEIGIAADQMGWEIIFEPANNQWRFEVIIGEDRTEGTASPIYFDLELETILSQQWVESETNTKNYAIVAGQGEGAAREIITRYLDATEPTGWNRREVFIDARDLPELTSLEVRGDQKLQETKVEDSVSVSLNMKGAFQYRNDWDLGDMITVRNEEWGLKKDMRIISVKLSYKGNEGLVGVDVELDKHIPTLKSRIIQEIERADLSGRRI